MKILGVEFASLSVIFGLEHQEGRSTPNRRLQVLAVLIWICLFFWTVPITVLVLYYWLFHSYYFWPFALMYIGWNFYDLDICNKGGRR